MVTDFFGTYEGIGSWHEADGKSAAYRVHQTIRPVADDFEVAFRHDFDDGNVVEATFAMIWITSDLFRVLIAGKEVGNGYSFGGYCHYHLETDTAIVEASYRLTGGGLEVFGSSSTNAAGNFIAWQESLRRL
jgi:hypothetical protein